MEAQGFGRKGMAGGAGARPAPMLRPAPPHTPLPGDAGDPYAAMRAGFVAQERLNAAGHVDTLAWDTPTSGRSWSKSRLIAYLLWFVTGAVAGHRLYCGRYISAGLQSLIGLVGFCALLIAPHSLGTWGPLILIHGTWRLFDLFLIPGMCRNPPDAY